MSINDSLCCTQTNIYVNILYYNKNDNKEFTNFIDNRETQRPMESKKTQDIRNFS